MFWIAQPKSASSSLGYTLAKHLKAQWINGLVTKPKKLCKGFTEIQKYHNTMVPRTKEHILKYCVGFKAVYKEHILPTDKHLDILRGLNKNIMILLRDPKESYDCYVRFNDNEVVARYGWKIVDLPTIQKDIYEFYNKYSQLKDEKLPHLLYITYRDLLLDYENTMIKIFNHYRIKFPDVIPPLEKKKYTGIGLKRL